MKPGNNRILVIYFLIVLVNLIGNYFGETGISHFSKVLLMPVLFRYVSSVEWLDKKLKRYVSIALIFSWFGDILLIFSGEYPSAFILGLSSFLLGHVAYIFSNLKSQIGKNSLSFVVPVILIIVVSFSGWYLINTLFAFLGDMKTPVVLYAFVIMAMAITAALRYGKTSRLSFWLVSSGAMIFMLSDSMIAIDKFYSAIDYARVLIMGTYTLAQFLLVYGYKVHNSLD